MHLCPDLSPPKPLEHSKNVTIRTYHKLPGDENWPKNWPKIGQKIGQKGPKIVTTSQNLIF